MLTLPDLKHLYVKSNCMKQGTLLKLTSDYTIKTRKGTIVEFAGFHFFRDEKETKVKPLLKKFKNDIQIPHARCWGDFTEKSQHWVEENYEPVDCHILFMLDGQIQKITTYHVVIHI